MRIYTKAKQSKRLNISKFYLAVTFAFIMATFVSLYSAAAELNLLKQKRAEYVSMIAAEQKKQVDIESMKHYYESDSYIEKIAREKLGLIKSNDVIFPDRNAK